MAAEGLTSSQLSPPLNEGASCPGTWHSPRPSWGEQSPWVFSRPGTSSPSLCRVPSGRPLPSLGLRFLTCEMGEQPCPPRTFRKGTRTEGREIRQV